MLYWGPSNSAILQSSGGISPTVSTSKRGKTMISLDKLIKQTATAEANILMTQFNNSQIEYAQAIKTLQDTDYQSHWDMMPDIRRVSLLGLAVVDLGKAYSEMNSARCN